MIHRLNILMILTSHDSMMETDSKTGVWLGEMSDPYYKFVDAGYMVHLASPLGGHPPVDPMSKLTEHVTAANRRFMDDSTAQQRFMNTLSLENVDASAFDAVFIPGGHGPLWDLARHPRVGELLSDFVIQRKPMGAVCHGPAALIALEEVRPGFLMDRKITSFTGIEEKLVLRSNHIPYNLESRLKGLGADFSSAIIPFAPHVVQDGKLITGQNPLSAGPTATRIVEILQETEK